MDDIVTEKFLRKPLEVEAVQVTAENFEQLARWCQGTITNNDGTTVERVNPGGQHIKIRVHNPKNTRQTKAFVGDWILYTDKGYKIYPPKAFKASFDAVPTPETPQTGKVQAVSKQGPPEKATKYEGSDAGPPPHAPTIEGPPES